MAGYTWRGDKPPAKRQPTPHPGKDDKQVSPPHVVPNRIVRYHQFPTDLEMPTTREIELIKMLALGMSNAQIAGKMFITEDTVKSHIRRITIKLQAQSLGRAGIVGRCFRYGIITPDSVWPEGGINRGTRP